MLARYMLYIFQETNIRRAQIEMVSSHGCRKDAKVHKDWQTPHPNLTIYT